MRARPFAFLIAVGPFAVSLLLGGTANSIHAQEPSKNRIRVNRVFSDNMVLQRGMARAVLGNRRGRRGRHGLVQRPRSWSDRQRRQMVRRAQAARTRRTVQAHNRRTGKQNRVKKHPRRRRMDCRRAVEYGHERRKLRQRAGHDRRLNEFTNPATVVRPSRQPKTGIRNRRRLVDRMRTDHHPAFLRRGLFLRPRFAKKTACADRADQRERRRHDGRSAG